MKQFSEIIRFKRSKHVSWKNKELLKIEIEKIVVHLSKVYIQYIYVYYYFMNLIIAI